jgi:hypothetical protein
VVDVTEPPLHQVERRRSELKAAMARLDEALRQLEDLDFDPAGWVDGVRTSVAGLVTAFDQHVRLHEGPESFHAEVLKAQPHLASRITRLQRDHVKLRSSLEGLVTSLEQAGTEAGDRVSLLAKDVLHQLDAHRRRGAALVWEAFNYDLGGEH